MVADKHLTVLVVWSKHLTSIPSVVSL